MDFSEIFTSLVGLFSGGLSGAVSNLMLLAALVITAIKIRSWLKTKAYLSSKQQVRDDRSETVSENQSKDSQSHEDEKSLDTWRKEMRNVKRGESDD